MTTQCSKANLSLIPNKVISFGARAAFAKPEWASPARGLEKAAEPRVIYLYLSDIQTIVLVKLYGKAKKSDLSKAEENELRVISAEIRGSLGSRKP